MRDYPLTGTEYALPQRLLERRGHNSIYPMPLPRTGVPKRNHGTLKTTDLGCLIGRRQALSQRIQEKTAHITLLQSMAIPKTNICTRDKAFSQRPCDRKRGTHTAHLVITDWPVIYSYVSAIRDNVEVEVLLWVQLQHQPYCIAWL